MLLAGSSRAAGVAHRVRSRHCITTCLPSYFAHATCTCTYACAYVPIHVHAYVSLKQPVRLLFHVEAFREPKTRMHLHPATVARASMHGRSLSKATRISLYLEAVCPAPYFSTIILPQ